MSGVTLDTGALIGLERNDRRIFALLEQANLLGFQVVVPAGALAQAWRDGRKQARLAQALKSPAIQVVPLDAKAARAAGQLCAIRATMDVIDASVVLCARARGHAVVTSDPGDLARLDPTLKLILV